MRNSPDVKSKLEPNLQSQPLENVPSLLEFEQESESPVQSPNMNPRTLLSLPSPDKWQHYKRSSETLKLGLMYPENNKSSRNNTPKNVESHEFITPRNARRLDPNGKAYGTPVETITYKSSGRNRKNSENQLRAMMPMIKLHGNRQKTLAK